MSRANKKNSRLGRGLGSLLGPTSDESPSNQVANKIPLEENRVLADSQEVSPKQETKLGGSPKQALVEAVQQKQEQKKDSAPQVIEKVVEKIIYKEQKVPEAARIWKIAVEKIVPNPFQPRQHFDKEKVEELAESIREQGILQPIVVRKTADQKLEIISGERRWRAAQIAKLKEVPVIIREVDDQNSLELALIENIQRADLNPLEEAEAYQRLADEFGLTQEQIALKVGKKRASITNTLRLLGLSPEVREYLMLGKVSQGHAKALLSVGDPIKQRELANRIVAEKLSVRAAEALAAQTHIQRQKKENVAGEIAVRLARQQAQELQKILGTKVKIDYANGRGRIALQFYSDEQFNDIVERLKDSWS